MPLLTCIAAPDAKSGDLFTPRTAFGEFRGLPEALQRPTGEKACDDPEAQRAMWVLSENAVSQEFDI